MSIMDEIIAKVKGQNKVVVLPEGQDTRVIAAAAIATKKEIAKVIVLATPQEIEQHRAAGLPVDAGFTVVDWTNSQWADQLANKYFELRQSKGVTLEAAQKKVNERLYFGTMMVKVGLAEGLVAGSISSTGDMLRAAFQCVGTAPGIKTASSHFIMELQTPTPTGETTLMFSDCAVNPDPTAEQLSDIAMATIDQYRTLVGGEVRMAFLSFSSYGSAAHPDVEKVANAVKMTKEKVEAKGWLDVFVDGEMQSDAALVPSVAAQKVPGSKVGGRANVLIFPDLQSANISYKLVQRLAGAEAYGPILQGLASPVNDLSRGCIASDIVGVIAITAGQAMGK